MSEGPDYSYRERGCEAMPTWEHQVLTALQQSSQVVLLLVKKYATYPVVVVERDKALACRAVEQRRDEDLVEHRETACRAELGA